MNITIKQLQVFVTVAKHNNVSQAALEIFLSQSAVSTALAELEMRLKTQLFSRNGKAIILNQHGKALLPKAQAVLNQIKEINQLFSTTLISDDLTIGASANISKYLLTDLIKTFLTEEPSIKIAIKIKNPEQIVDDLQQFKIDIGFSETFCYHPALESIPWYDDSFVIVAAKNHALSSKKNLTAKDLRDCEWILPEKSAGTSEIFESHIAPNLTKINVRMTVVHNDVIRQLVAGGFGVSFMSTIALKGGADGIVALNAPFIELNRKFYIVIRKNDNNSKLRKFLSICELDNPALNLKQNKE